MLSPELISALFWIVRVLLLSTFGGTLVAHGIVSSDNLEAFANNTTTIIFGTIGFIATVGAAWWTRRKAAVIARVAAMPEVHQVVTTPEIAAAQPSDKVVPTPGQG